MHQSRRIPTAVAAATVMLTVGMLAVPVTGTSASDHLDPVAATAGFLAVIEGDTVLASHESEGPMAIGGDPRPC